MRLLALIILFLSCTAPSTGENNGGHLADSLKTVKKEDNKVMDSNKQPVEVDSLSTFLSLFDCDNSREDVDYEFYYCNRIPFEYAVKYLDHNPDNKAVSFFSGEMMKFTNGYRLTYYTTCGAGGFCYGKLLTYLNTDGLYLGDYILEELFGDMEISTQIVTTPIDDFTFLRETIKTEISMETLDTLSVRKKSDTLRVNPPFEKE